MALVEAVEARLGPNAVALGHKCAKIEQDESGATVHFVDTVTGEPLPSVRGTVAIACDGVNSVMRKDMHPNEAKPRYEGTTQYRGATVWKPFLTGRSMLYFGTYETGKLIIYPMRDNVDGEGNQLINWVIEISRDDLTTRDWNRASNVNEFIEHFESMKFDFLDVPGVLSGADVILEYPMVDQDPLSHWTEGNVTLLGDAAHPMMPRGSNGAAQAIIDARVLAEELSSGVSPQAALKSYEAKRLPATSNVVLANRGQAPDAILRVVEERTGGKPFERIEDVISQEELVAWQENYRKLAGFRATDLQER
jgi:2-polyprenyl-6-methoxyphenol hydroxylase-like FAD-dependent oxidoreductase